MKKISLVFFIILVCFNITTAQTDINLSTYKDIIADYFSNIYDKNSLCVKKKIIQKDSAFFNTLEEIDSKTIVVDKITSYKEIKKNQIFIKLIAETLYKEEDFFVKEIRYEVERKVNKDIFVLEGYFTFKIKYNAKLITITEISNVGLGTPEIILHTNR